MPFLPNLADLKGMASSLYPLNAFVDHATIDSPTESTSTASAQATAGPGPSSQAAARERESALRQSTLAVPIRPSLIKSPEASSVSSFEDVGRRRSSGNSVVLVDPEFDADDHRSRRAADGQLAERPRSRRMSVASDIRRVKKAPTDTYIIVRPPPTSAKNALNLQIQLVVRDARPRDRSMSTATTASRSNSVSTDLASLATSTTSGVSGVDIPRSASATQVSIASGSNISRSEVSSQSSSEERDRATSRKRSNSIKSTSTTLSGTARKRVEPMFNLTVHNVMQPTVVTDAATDVKVAKFLKRSLDVLGVGVLEPAEVWLASSPLLSVNPSNDEETITQGRRARPISMISMGTPLSPTVTRQSDGATIRSPHRNSFDASLGRTSTDLKNFRLDATQENRAKKFFGKVFKRKTQDTAAPVEARRSNTFRRRSPSPNPSVDCRGQPKSNGTSQNGDHPHHSAHATFGTLPLVVRRRSSDTIVSPDGAVTGLTAPSTLAPPATLGSSPTPSFLNEKRVTLAGSSRPVGYTWSVRKWAKKNNEGWAAHLTAAAAAGLEMVNGVITAEGDGGDDDVVFEWVKQRTPASSTPPGEGLAAITSRMSKGRVPSRPGSRANSRPGSRANSRPPSTRGDILDSVGTTGTGSLPTSPNPVPLDRRPDAVRRVSGSVSPRRISPPHSDAEGDHETASLHTLDTTAEEDSDPEDSETPWTCSIWVKKTGQRQLLGTLTPAPHHPKVVGVLKIPLRLDPVSLQEVRGQGKEGQEEAATRIKEEVCLTEENLKDVDWDESVVDTTNEEKKL